jgi:hypothetical protein
VGNDPFTVNKQKIRELNLRLIERQFHSRKGELKYFGLPAASMKDILLWQDYFMRFTVVERGRPGEEYRLQHNLELTAMRYGLTNRVYLLRGDLDDILLRGQDNYGNLVDYPFDVVTLDYSGGLIYKDLEGKSIRTDSIAELIRRQATLDQSFLLLISCNTDNEDRGEIRRVFNDILTSLAKLKIDATPTIQAFLNHSLEQARLSIYVPYLIRNLSWANYQCKPYKPVFYLGNRNTQMMNFSFWLKRTTGTVAGSSERRTLLDLLDLKTFECVEGDLTETDFGIPRVSLN